MNALCLKWFWDREVDGTACEVRNKVETHQDAVREAKMPTMRIMITIYGMILLDLNCEWDDDKDEDGG
ncbi:hypothetical protein Bca52824_045769 [Brassica carinata]|uniref:Uncharacterized protein n=1 Tax=Brassica carinata TaxID=52824 RepID=A0A8X7RFW9_BRACI|nr:hypothetical protein Bca52824_045769 [Brassica carinata]